MKKSVLLIILLVFSLATNAQQLLTAQFPKVTIAGKSSGEITVKEIISAGGLQTTHSSLTITHFVFTIKNDGNSVTAASNSAKLTNQMIGYLKSLKKGDKFYIEEIETVTSSGKVIQLAPQNFAIK
jgi:hypothetical protein